MGKPNVNDLICDQVQRMDKFEFIQTSRNDCIYLITVYPFRKAIFHKHVASIIDFLKVTVIHFEN